MKNLRFTIVTAAFFIVSTSLWSHEVWIQPDKKGFIFYSGHSGNPESYDSSRVREFAGYNFAGKKTILRTIKSKYGARVTPGDSFSALTVFMDNKYWMETTEGWKNHNKRKGLTVIKSGNSHKYAKRIVKWENYLKRPLGQRLEIVPLKDPMELNKNDRLPVRIFYEGKEIDPRKEGTLKISIESGRSGKHAALKKVTRKGIYRVKIGKGKEQLVIVKLERNLGGTEVEFLASALSFEVE